MIATSKELIRDKVYLTIRDMILQGIIQPNTFIGEEQLATELKVSRTPIRNAFYRLQAEQMLEIIPYRGVLVKDLSAEEAAEIYDTRAVLEKRSANAFCNNHTLKIPERMYNILNEMHVTTQTAKKVELDLEFHWLIVKSSGNQVLLRVYDSIGARRMQAALLLAKKITTDNTPTEHHAILDAMLHRNADQACQLLSQHFNKEIAMLIPEHHRN